MSTSKRWRTNGLFLLVAVVGLVFASAGPASAFHSPPQGGGTSSIGYELGPDFDELCSSITQAFQGAQYETTYYLLTANGTYVMRDHSTGNIVAYFQGLVTMDAQHGDMVSAPQAARPGECDGNPVVADEIFLTDGWIADGASSGNVDCQMGGAGETPANGYYLRQLTDQVTIEMRLTCDITGNTSGLTGTVNDATITHRWTGTQTPCFEVPGGCVNPDAGSVLVGSYSFVA